MPSAFDRTEFPPPPPGGLLRATSLAIAAHLALLVALTYGLQWNREQQNVAAEAELWAAVPREAAPREVAPPPPPPPPPQPQPTVRTPPPPEPPAPREADIALEREKQKRELAERRQAEQEREKKKAEAQRKREEELARRKEQTKLAAEAKRLDEERKRLAEEASERKLAQQREENLKRMQGLAGATGGPDARGSAPQSAGPSASYAGRLAALFKRNMNFPVQTISGNPKAQVQVRVGPSGTILSVRLTRPSGVAAWDEAVLRAIEATQRVPADENGSYVSEFPLSWGPRD